MFKLSPTSAQYIAPILHQVVTHRAVPCSSHWWALSHSAGRYCEWPFLRGTRASAGLISLAGSHPFSQRWALAATGWMWACSTTLAYCITVCVCTLSGNGYKWDTKLVLPSGFSSYQGQSCETVWSVCQASFSMIHNVASMQCLSSCSPFFFPWAHLCSSCTFILFIQCPSLSLHIIRCLWWTRRSCWMWWLWLQVFSSLSSSQWTLHCIMFLTKFLYHWWQCSCKNE